MWRLEKGSELARIFLSARVLDPAVWTFDTGWKKRLAEQDKVEEDTSYLASGKIRVPELPHAGAADANTATYVSSNVVVDAEQAEALARESPRDACSECDG